MTILSIILIIFGSFALGYFTRSLKPRSARSLWEIERAIAVKNAKFAEQAVKASLSAMHQKAQRTPSCSIDPAS